MTSSDRLRTYRAKRHEGRTAEPVGREDGGTGPEDAFVVQLHDYRDFEGVIAEGEYGAGAVLIWDEGSYRNLSERLGKRLPLADALRAGHASLWRDGARMRGGWALTRFRGGGSGRAAWLLVKESDERAGRHLATGPRVTSVRSHRTLRQIAERESAR